MDWLPQSQTEGIEQSYFWLNELALLIKLHLLLWVEVAWVYFLKIAYEAIFLIKCKTVDTDEAIRKTERCNH